LNLLRRFGDFIHQTWYDCEPSAAEKCRSKIVRTLVEFLSFENFILQKSGLEQLYVLIGDGKEGRFGTSRHRQLILDKLAGKTNQLFGDMDTISFLSCVFLDKKEAASVRVRALGLIKLFHGSRPPIDLPDVLDEMIHLSIFQVNQPTTSSIQIPLGGMLTDMCMVASNFEMSTLLSWPNFLRALRKNMLVDPFSSFGVKVFHRFWKLKYNEAWAECFLQVDSVLQDIVYGLIDSAVANGPRSAEAFQMLTKMFRLKRDEAVSTKMMSTLLSPLLVPRIGSQSILAKLPVELLRGIGKMLFKYVPLDGPRFVDVYPMG